MVKKSSFWLMYRKNIKLNTIFHVCSFTNNSMTSPATINPIEGFHYWKKHNSKTPDHENSNVH